MAIPTVIPSNIPHDPLEAIPDLEEGIPMPETKPHNTVVQEGEETITSNETPRRKRFKKEDHDTKFLSLALGGEFAPGSLAVENGPTLSGNHHSFNIRFGARYYFDKMPKMNLYGKFELLLGYGASSYQLESSESPNGAFSVKTNDIRMEPQLAFLVGNEKRTLAAGPAWKLGFAVSSLSDKSRTFIRRGSADVVSENDFIDPSIPHEILLHTEILKGAFMFDIGFQFPSNRLITGHNIMVGSTGAEIEGPSSTPVSIKNLLLGFYIAPLALAGAFSKRR